MRITHLFAFLLFFSFNVFAQHDHEKNLLIQSKLDNPISSLTHFDAGQIQLVLDLDLFNSIKQLRPCDLNIQLPFFDNQILNLELEAFNAYSNDFELLRSTEDGLITENYQPNIQSYRIIGPSRISGSISFMRDFLIGVIKKDGLVYEIKSINDSTYVLFDVNQSVVESVLL